MRKIGEKVALVAQICVAVIFVATSILYALGVIPQVVWQGNAVMVVLMLVLALIFAGTSVYLVYANFSEVQSLKRILLYADCKSATTTNVKVLNKIAKNCSDKIDGVRIVKTKIRADEKKGYVATFVVEVMSQTATPALEQLRCLIEDSFKETLGLVFNTITFDVVRLASEPKADVKKAQKRAKAITDGVEQVQDIYQNPTGEKPTDVVMPLPTDEQGQATSEQPAEEQIETVGATNDTVPEQPTLQTVESDLPQDDQASDVEQPVQYEDVTDQTEEDSNE